MAYTRLSDKKIIATNLGTYINSQLSLITKARMRRNLEDEAIFTRSVLENNLTIEQQLDYRKNQLKRVSRQDTDERRRIKNEIASLKDLAEQKDYSDKYLEQINSLNSGMQSIEMTLSWLTDRLSRTTDLRIKQDIKENINKFKGMRYEQQQKALASQTDFENRDKTDKVIDKQIKKVNDQMVLASRAGNEDYLSLLDLQLQSLKKTKTETGISKAIMDFSTATLVGQSAIGTLTQFNQQIRNSDDTIPITIGGTTYDSAKQFWETKRGEYLSDRSSNGFFPRYSGELAEQISYKQSRGAISDESLSQVKEYYESIKDRPELSDYQDRISYDQQSALQSTADIRAQSILNEFATKLDAKKAIGELGTIQDVFGVDQTLNYQKIISSAASEKESQVRDILTTMQQDMRNTPGLSQQEYLQRAIGSGAGTLLSPTDLATSKASDIVTGLGDKSKKQQFGESNQITVDPNKEGSSFAQKTKFTEGGLYRKPGETTVYKMENGQLRPLTGNWNEEMLKKATGKGYSAVKEVNNLSQTPFGSEIKATAVAPTITNNTVTTNTKQSSAGYSSIVDYLKATGQNSSFDYRKKLYEQQGLGKQADFTGTSQQNISLLKSFLK